MSEQLFDFLRDHEEAFRSRARLASLYSDFRFQRTTNPDGYQANVAVWLKALAEATRAGVISPSYDDRLILHSGETLQKALQTAELGRPLALGAVIDEAVKQKAFVPQRTFVDAKQSVYARASWIPSMGQVAGWGLRQLGITSEYANEDRLARGEYVLLANVEAAAKVILEYASTITTSNCSRIYSRELFADTFSASLELDAISPSDLSVLLIHLSRDCAALSYSPATNVVKFKSPSEAQPSPISEEDASIASIRTLIHSLQPQITRLTEKVAEFDRAARNAVSSKQLPAAKIALRQKKASETTLERRAATLTQLEDVYAKIEQAADNVEMIRVMTAAGQTLRTLNRQTGGVENVQDAVDSLREEMADVDEINQALNEAAAGDVDEMEVEDELEEMEKAEQAKHAEAEKKAAAQRAEGEVEETRRRLADLDGLGKKSKDTDDLVASPEKERREAVNA